MPTHELRSTTTIRPLTTAALALPLMLVAGASYAANKCPRPTETVKVNAGFLKARDLVSMSDADLAAYLRGFVNGLTVGPFLSMDPGCVAAVRACVKDRSEAELSTTLRGFLSERPAEFEHPAAVTSYEALLEPCL